MSVEQSRRGFLKVATGFGATAALTAAFSDPAAAQKAPKKSVQYQTEPKKQDGNVQKCANCQFYVPGESGDGVGKCQIVAGEVKADAWCNLWAAK